MINLNKLAVAKVILLLPIICLLFSQFTHESRAAEFLFKSYSMDKSSTINDDLYIFGETIKLDGTINGDVFAVGENISIGGDVNGDLYLLGNSVNLDNNTVGNVFIGGNSVIVKGEIIGDLYSVANTFTFTGDCKKDAWIASIANNLSGNFSDDVRMATMSSTTDADINGDLILLGQKWSVDEAKISGNIYYNSTIEKIANDQGVNVREKSFSTKIKNFIASKKLFIEVVTIFINFVSLLLAGALVIYLAPVKTGTICNRITLSIEGFIKCTLVGLLVMFIAPFLIIFLSLSVFGMYIAFMVIGFILFALLVGRIWVETAIGMEILHMFRVKKYMPYKSLLIGRVLSTILSCIAITNVYYNILVMLTALGAVVLVKRDGFVMGRKLAKK
ncbi:hypothetical protein J6Z48_00965 [bacterium]|nr:hypothetical protein [bacterium]